MRKLIVSLLIIAAMFIGALVGMAPFLANAAMTEPILDEPACSNSNPCSNLFEFKVAISPIIDKTLAAMKADVTLKVEILAFAAKWNVGKTERFTNVMLAIKSIYAAASISRDRIILVWANKAGTPEIGERYQMQHDDIYIRLIK